VGEEIPEEVVDYPVEALCLVEGSIQVEEGEALLGLVLVYLL
jgi:hypothetical protein